MAADEMDERMLGLDSLQREGDADTVERRRAPVGVELHEAAFIRCRGTMATVRKPKASLADPNGVGPVIINAAYDADPLEAFIAADQGPTSQIKADPSCSIAPRIG